MTHTHDMILMNRFSFRPGFPGGPPGMCGPRLGLPLPPPPFLDFYGMPGGLDGNYRKVSQCTESVVNSPKNLETKSLRKMCSMPEKRQLWNMSKLRQSSKRKTNLRSQKMRCTQKESKSRKGTSVRIIRRIDSVEII